MNRRRAAAALLSLAMLLLTGCWDLREMNQLALVMAVGIDKAETPGRLAVTVQIARPSSRAKGGTGESGGGGSPVYVATADGDTIFGAIRNLAQFTSRRIMWAHNNVVVVGEDLAREDMLPVIDFFTRNQELRMRTWIAVTRGTDARSIITANTGMEDIPANSISALLRNAQLPGESVRSEVAEVTAQLFASDSHPVMAVLELKNRGLKPSAHPQEEEAIPQAVLSGTAIFKETKLMGYVSRETGRGLLWLRRQIRNAVMSIPCPKGLPGTMAVEIRSPKVSVRSYVGGGAAPTMEIQVQSQGWLAEQDCATPSLTATELKGYAQEALADKIKAEMFQTLAYLQGDLNTDAVRYARLLHVQHPAWWRANSARFDQIFPKIKTRIAVQVDITKMSLFTRPMRAHTP